MDVCVVTYRNTADRVRPGLRPEDRLWVRDNTDDNIGFARAANELAAKGVDALILFINPDGDPQPGCFDRLEASFADPGVVATAANEGPDWVPPPSDWLAGSCLAVRREAFERVGGFDESLFMYSEDVDLSWKLSRLGQLKLRWDAVFLHDTGSRGWLALFRKTRNEFIVHRRWGRPLSATRVAHRGFHNLRRGLWGQGTSRLAAVAVWVGWDRPIATGKSMLRASSQTD
jgi:GT2 family glycosyltransferase